MLLARRLSMTLMAATAALLLTEGASRAQDKELVFGLQCDRTGATQTVGPFLCPGYHDYIALINSKGGIEGYKVRVLEIDHEYKVPAGMEAHERFKKEGAIIEGVYGTPHAAALLKKLEEDKIPGTTPGSSENTVASFMSPCFRRTQWPSFRSMAGMISMEYVEKYVGKSAEGEVRRNTANYGNFAESGSVGMGERQINRIK